MRFSINLGDIYAHIFYGFVMCQCNCVMSAILSFSAIVHSGTAFNSSRFEACKYIFLCSFMNVFISFKFLLDVILFVLS